MPINEEAVERSGDAKFAYIDLKKDEYGKWEDIDKDDKNDRVRNYKEVNDDNNIQINILDHIKHSGSGFQATLIEKTDSEGNITKVLAIAGTDDIMDLDADYSLLLGNVPILHFKAATEFVAKLIDENKMTQADKIELAAPSLGGTIGQMLTAVFKDYIDNAYTFNSPGAANLQLNTNQADFWGWTPETHAHFDMFNENKDSVSDKIINFTAASWPTFIADLGEIPEQDDDIGIEIRMPVFILKGYKTEAKQDYFLLAA